MEDCFRTFDKDGDGALNVEEFTSLCAALFRNEHGKPYKLQTSEIDELLSIFNVSASGSLKKDEFKFCWSEWIKKVARPSSALVVVDVQNDFISGSLAIINCPAAQNGEDVVAPINNLIDTVPFDMHCYSLDWHPSDHVSFIDNIHLRELHPDSTLQDPGAAELYQKVVFSGPPKTEQVLWPRHCVQNSWGAELHKDLKVHPKARVVYKGVNPNVDSYSAFFDNAKLGKTCLEELISNEGCSDVYVCGIATDVCVASTAFHAQDLGFRTILIDDCSRGINNDNINDCFDKIRSQFGCVVQSSEVKAMVQGHDRRPALGIQLARKCRDRVQYPPQNPNSKLNVDKQNNN